MNNSNYRDEIVGLEALTEELTAKIENCRKFIVAGRIAVGIGGAVLVAMLVGIAGSDPSIMGLAAAAVLGGIVVAGSNRSTAKEASTELSAAEAKRAEVINQLELQTVSERDGLQPLPPSGAILPSKKV
jgi:hypothetical protein